MILKGRTISKGYAEGNVLKFDKPLSFLGDVDVSTGRIKDEEVIIRDKILVFPEGKGSTVGSFVIYNLKAHGKAPMAIINSSAEAIIATGAVISSIPMIDSINIDLITNGDRVIVNANEGVIEIKNIEVKEVVSLAVIIDKSIMLFNQPEWHDLHLSEWALLTNNIKESEAPEHAAIRGIREKFKINVISPKKLHEPITIRNRQTVWNIHFFAVYLEHPIPNIKNNNFERKLFSYNQMPSMNINHQILNAIKNCLVDVDHNHASSNF